MPSARLRFSPQFDVAVRSRTGVGALQRPENQDNYLLIDLDGQASFLRAGQPHHRRVPGWTAGHARVAVLDGMGGHAHGREAAEATAEELMTMPPCHSAGELSLYLDALHTRLQHRFAQGGGSPLRPGTTLTLLELPPTGPALLYHVGDSRLYEITPAGAHVLTVDHVPATVFAMAGLLDERDWWQQVHAEHRPQIAQAFILGNSIDNPVKLSDPLRELTAANLPPWLRHLPDRRPVALHPGATYLLATDGFWSCADPSVWVAGWPQLLANCGSAADVVETLFREMEANPPPGLQADNLTALVLRPLADRGDETALPGR